LMEGLARAGLVEERGWLEEALGVRREFPRWGEVEGEGAGAMNGAPTRLGAMNRAPTRGRLGEAPALMRLREAVPGLAARLFEAMEARGLVDPTFEGRGGGAYEPDGTRKAEMPKAIVLGEPEGWRTRDGGSED